MKKSMREVRPVVINYVVEPSREISWMRWVGVKPR